MNPFSNAYAAVYDRLAAREDRRGGGDLRALLVGPAVGDVLELGAGSGRCLPWYTTARRVVAVEPDGGMRHRAERQAEKAPVAVQVMDGDAMGLPFGDGSFDTVVTAWVLCMVPDPARALKEIRRVLRSTGSFRFCEHVRSSDDRAARRQDQFAPAWRVIGRGCRCNQDTLRFIRDSGFEVAADYLEPSWTSPAIVRPTVLGVATVRSR